MKKVVLFILVMMVGVYADNTYGVSGISVPSCSGVTAQTAICNHDGYLLYKDGNRFHFTQRPINNLLGEDEAIGNGFGLNQWDTLGEDVRAKGLTENSFRSTLAERHNEQWDFLAEGTDGPYEALNSNGNEFIVYDRTYDGLTMQQSGSEWSFGVDFTDTAISDEAKLLELYDDQYGSNPYDNLKLNGVPYTYVPTDAGNRYVRLSTLSANDCYDSKAWIGCELADGTTVLSYEEWQAREPTDLGVQAEIVVTAEPDETPENPGTSSNPGGSANPGGAGGSSSTWTFERDGNKVTAKSSNGATETYESKSGVYLPAEVGSVSNIGWQKDGDEYGVTSFSKTGNNGVTVTYTQTTGIALVGDDNTPLQVWSNSADDDLYVLTENGAMKVESLRIPAQHHTSSTKTNAAGEIVTSSTTVMQTHKVTDGESSLLTADDITAIRGINTETSEMLRHCDGDDCTGETFHQTSSGVHMEVYYDEELGAYVQCTRKGQNGCDGDNDGLQSTVLGDVGERAEQPVGDQAAPAYEPRTFTEITESFGDSNTRTLSAGAWLSGIAAAGGSTAGISQLVFGDIYIDDVRTRYDKWTHKLIGTEYMESFICQQHLTDQTEEGLSQIKLPDGSIATTAHVTAQKRGPQPLLCDMNAEEPCPNDGDCDDNLCYIDDEVMQAWEYIIEWTARAPADSALTPGVNEANEPYVSFNVWLQCSSDECPDNVVTRGESKWVPLYERDGLTEGVIQLEPGQQDTDRFITYSMHVYNEVHFDWAIAPQGVQWHTGSNFATDRGFQPNGDARDIYVEVEEIQSNPSSVQYEESQGSTSTMVSSTSSDVSRSTI